MMTAICKEGISLAGRKGKQPRATHATPCVAISRDICRYTAHVKPSKYFRCFLRMKCKPQTSQQQLQLNPDHKPPGDKFTSGKPQTFHTQQPPNISAIRKELKSSRFFLLMLHVVGQKKETLQTPPWGCAAGASSRHVSARQRKAAAPR